MTINELCKAMGQGYMPRPAIAFAGRGGIYLTMEGNSVFETAEDFVDALNAFNITEWCGDNFYVGLDYNGQNVEKNGDFKKIVIFRGDEFILGEKGTTPYFRIHRTKKGKIGIEPCQEEIDGTNCRDFLRAYVANLTRDKEKNQ